MPDDEKPLSPMTEHWIRVTGNLTVTVTELTVMVSGLIDLLKRRGIFSAEEVEAHLEEFRKRRLDDMLKMGKRIIQDDPPAERAETALNESGAPPEARPDP